MPEGTWNIERGFRPMLRTADHLNDTPSRVHFGTGEVEDERGIRKSSAVKFSRTRDGEKINQCGE